MPEKTDMTGWWSGSGHLRSLGSLFESGLGHIPLKPLLLDEGPGKVGH